MPHSKEEIKRRKGKLWHKEKSKLTLSEARALGKHLKKSGDKNTKVTHTPNGYEVWWTSKQEK